tara:strand:+ start:81479 stop:82747 length:1269 start_codon:yes stop_codon:yes gene_type:complete
MATTRLAKTGLAAALSASLAFVSSQSPGSAGATQSATAPLEQPDINSPEDSPGDLAQQENQLRLAIATVESAGGAYSPALAEQLLSLGLALQTQQRHAEALVHLRRGVHLTRINDGLYHARQIPLLKAEISSLVALEQYAQTDERQAYLHRVQTRALPAGKTRADALMQQAEWQYRAYQLALPGRAYQRLMNMWDLNQLALTDLIETEGEGSALLLTPLRGMLTAQYLISAHVTENEPTSGFESASAAPNHDLNRFYAYRARSYSNGQSIIRAMYDIERQNSGPRALTTVNALTMLGDWQFWHNRRDEAVQAYQDALAELAERDDAQTQAQNIFGAPVALPALDGLRPLPPAIEPAQGVIQLAFGVTERGRVINLERLDDNPETDTVATRLMRTLRKTRFRPRFDAGLPVTTDNVVRAYDVR